MPMLAASFASFSELVERQPRHARHRADRIPHAPAVHREERQDQVLDAQSGLPHHPPEERGFTEPARSVQGMCHEDPPAISGHAGSAPQRRRGGRLEVTGDRVGERRDRVLVRHDGHVEAVGGGRLRRDGSDGGDDHAVKQPGAWRPAPGARRSPGPWTSW